MEQQHTLYTWSGCRGTPRCRSSRTLACICWLTSWTWGSGQACSQACSCPTLPGLFSFSRVPGPGAYLTVKKGTGFFCRTPTSSKLKVARDC